MINTYKNINKNCIKYLLVCNYLKKKEIYFKF